VDQIIKLINNHIIYKILLFKYSAMFIEIKALKDLKQDLRIHQLVNVYFINNLTSSW